MATRAEIRTRAMNRADQNGPYPGVTKYNDSIDEAARLAYRDLVHGGFPFDETLQTLTITVPAARHDIGSGDAILGVKGVFRVEGGRLIPLKRKDRGSDAAMRSTENVQFATHYEAVMSINDGPGLKLFPPTATGTYQLAYLEEFIGFTLGDPHVWAGPAGSDELIVLEAAAKGASMEDNHSLAAALRDEYKDCLYKVLKMASSFDMNQAPVIRDVMGTSQSRDPFDYDIYRGDDF